MIDYQVQRVSDGALLRLAKTIVELSGDGSASFAVQGNTELKITQTAKLSRNEQSAFSGSSFFIQSGSISSESAGISFEFRRGLVYGLMPNGYSNWHAPASPFVDGIRLSGPRGSHRDTILKTIAREIPLGPPGGVLDGTVAESGEVIIQRLNDAVASAVDHTLERQRDLDRYREELEQRAEARISAEMARLAEKFALERAELQRKEDEFAERTKDIDDRSNTHVRRNLQKAMADLSRDTLKDRLFKRSELAFALPIVLAVIGVGILATFIQYELESLDALTKAVADTIKDTFVSEAKKPDLIASINRTIMFGQVRVAFQTVGAGLLAWFALGLTRQRYRQTSRWEHDLHRFRLDTERASFLIEGELEARKVNNMVLPDVVLDRFSRGLFANGHDDNSNEGIEIGTTLAHLLNRPAKIKIGPNGLEAEVDKSGIRRAIRESADAGNTEA